MRRDLKRHFKLFLLNTGYCFLFDCFKNAETLNIPLWACTFTHVSELQMIDSTTTDRIAP